MCIKLYSINGVQLHCSYIIHAYAAICFMRKWSYYYTAWSQITCCMLIIFWGMIILGCQRVTNECFSFAIIKCFFGLMIFLLFTWFLLNEKKIATIMQLYTFVKLRLWQKGHFGFTFACSFYRAKLKPYKSHNYIIT